MVLCDSGRIASWAVVRQTARSERASPASSNLALTMSSTQRADPAKSKTPLFQLPKLAKLVVSKSGTKLMKPEATTSQLHSIRH